VQPEETQYDVALRRAKEHTIRESLKIPVCPMQRWWWNRDIWDKGWYDYPELPTENAAMRSIFWYVVTYSHPKFQPEAWRRWCG